MTLREPPKPPGATSDLIGRMVALILLLAMFALVVWVATTNGQIPLVERADPFLDPPGEHVRLQSSLVHYRRLGSGSEPVVLIHDDTVAGGATLVEVGQSVAEEGGPVVVPDLVGFGLSGRPDEPGRLYTVAGQAETLAELLEEIGISSAELVGFGWGGGVATELAVIRPELVASLVLVDTRSLPVSSSSGWETLEALPLGVGKAVSYQLEGATANARDRFFAGCEEGGWCDSSVLAEGYRRAVEVPGTAESIRARRASGQASVASDRLDEIDVPVTVVWSTGNQEYSRADAEEFAARFARTDVVAIDEVSARPQLNAPGEVAAIVSSNEE